MENLNKNKRRILKLKTERNCNAIKSKLDNIIDKKGNLNQYKQGNCIVYASRRMKTGVLFGYCYKTKIL